MTFAGSSLTTFAQAFGRGLRKPTHPQAADDAFDPYESVPHPQSEATVPSEEAEQEPFFVAEKLRESERHERDTMSLIRAALYASD